MSSVPDLPEPYKQYKLHEETLEFLNHISILKWKESVLGDNIEDVRKYWDSSVKKLNKDVTFNGQKWDDVIPIEGVEDGIAVTVYKPTNTPKNPSILFYFHGGGWVVGSRQLCENACQSISSMAGCICINVEYRLCPEVEMSAIYSDACHIMRYAIQNKVKFGGTSDSKVGIAGDSAGGTITAHTAHDVPEIDFQILIYPCVDHSFTTKSTSEFQDDAIIPLDVLKWFFSRYRNTEPRDPKDPKVSAICRPSFAQLPPALFIVAELDPLRDESFLYEEKLKSAGVQTELHLFKGIPHVFFWHTDVFKETCKEAYGYVSEFIRKIQ